MGKGRERNYQLKSTNKHLLNIFEPDYYIELGSVDIEVINSLLDGQMIDFHRLGDPHIMAEGLGSFASSPEVEEIFQLNYLWSLVAHSSSNKLFLTSGIIQYNSTVKEELYAPLILIPVKLLKTASNNWAVAMQSEPIANELLIQRLNELTIEKMPAADNIRSAYDIDRYCQKVAKASGCSFKIENYLTFARTEYPDFSFASEELFDGNSFYEYPLTEIYENALSSQKPLLPSNIYQKYIMLKAAKNESFVVSGKIRSGKTSTIINIIATKIAQNKRVLYVNNDDIQIDRVAEELSKLGLYPYTVNLTDPFYRPKSTPIVSDYSLRGLKQDIIKTVNKVLTFDRLLDTKYHGFRYRDLVEQLLLLNAGKKAAANIPVSEELEKFEVDALYIKMGEMEQALEKVGPFSENLWRAFENYYSASDIKEVADATNYFQKVQIDIQNEFDFFCQKYRLTGAKTIKDAHRLIYIFKGFNDSIPPYSWHNRSDYEKALEELNYLKHYKFNYDKHLAEIDKLYTGPIENVDIDAVFRILHGPYYTPQDATSIDRILANMKTIKGLVKRISLNKKIIGEAFNSLKANFQIKTVEDYMYALFIRLNDYLNSHAANPLWVRNSFENNADLLDEFAGDFAAYQEFKEIEDRMNRYFKTSLSYENIYQRLTTEAGDKTVDRLVNIRLLQEEHLSLDELIKNLKRYLELDGVLLKKTTKYKFVDYVDLGTNYLEFKAYYELMNVDKREKAFIRKMLSGFLDKGENRQKSLLNTLSVFANLFNENLDFIEQLKYYNININTDSPSEKLSQLYRFNQYYNSIYSLYEKFKVLFREDGVLTYRDFEELGGMIATQNEMKKELEAQDDRYYYLFGEFYHGFKTDCTALERLAAYFELFRGTIQNEDDLVDLLDRDTLTEIIRQSNVLEKLYEKWYAAFRRFGKLFRGGKLSFFEETFADNLNRINDHVKHLPELPEVFAVLSGLSFLRKYALDDLADGIYNGIYGKGMADGFILTILNRYKNAIENDSELLKQFPSVMEAAEDYSILEKTYLKQNMETIMSKHPLLDEKSRKKELRTQDYRHLLDSLSRDKQLFLSDLDFMNTDLDLTLFDTVIVDDAHLENSNKYNRLNENLNQIIIFGDRSFTTSVANNLMQRIKPSAIVDMKYRYQRMGSDFHNELSPSNIYIPRFEANVEVMKINSLNSVIDAVISTYNQSFEKVTNIIIASNKTRHILFQQLLSKLASKLRYEDALRIMKTRINIIDAIHENAMFADDIYVIFDDFKMMETDIILRILNNFHQANHRLIVAYLEDNAEERDQKTLHQIESLLAKKIEPPHNPRPLLRYISEELQKAGINADYGFGCMDFIIRGEPNIGIILIGLKQDESKPFIDIYQYYYQTFINFGWDIRIIYVPPLTDNPHQIVEEIIEMVNRNAK